jgi:hypothetical protein
MVMDFLWIFFRVVRGASLLGFRDVDVVFLWCACGIWCGKDGQETTSI